MIYTLRPATLEKRKHLRQVRAEVSSVFFPVVLVTKKERIGSSWQAFQSCHGPDLLLVERWLLSDQGAAQVPSPLGLSGSAFPVPASLSSFLTLIPPCLGLATHRLLTLTLNDPFPVFVSSPSSRQHPVLLEALVCVPSPGGPKLSEGPSPCVLRHL